MHRLWTNINRRESWIALATLTLLLVHGPVQADLVASDTFGGSFWATSIDAGKNSLVQTGTATFEDAGQVLTGGSQPDIGVTSSQTELPNGSWEVVLDFSTLDSNPFILAGSAIDGEEINIWSLYLGDTIRSSNSLLLTQPVQFNSVSSRWMIGGSDYQVHDDLNRFNSQSQSISGFARLELPAGGNVGFDAGSDLGTSNVNRVMITFNLTAIPEPSSGGLLLLFGFAALIRRRVVPKVESD